MPPESLPSSTTTPEKPAPAKKRRGWRRLLLLAAVLLVLGGAFHRWILTQCAYALIATSAVQSADAAVVFGGDETYIEAARWWRNHQFREFLVFRSAPGRLTRLGILAPGSEVARRALRKHAISEGDISELAQPVPGMRGLLLRLEEWLTAHPSQTVVLVCDEWSSAWLQLKVQRHMDRRIADRVAVVALVPAPIRPESWWKSSTGQRLVIEQSIRLAAAWMTEGGHGHGERTADEFRRAAVAQ